MVIGELNDLAAQIEEDERRLRMRIIKHELQKMQTKKELAIIEDDLTDIKQKIKEQAEKQRLRQLRLDNLNQKPIRRVYKRSPEISPKAIKQKIEQRKEHSPRSKSQTKKISKKQRNGSKESDSMSVSDKSEGTLKLEQLLKNLSVFDKVAQASEHKEKQEIGRAFNKGLRERNPNILLPVAKAKESKLDLISENKNESPNYMIK